MRILLIFILGVSSIFAYGQIEVKQTFVSCGYRVPYQTEVTCDIYYKKATETIWKKAYTPIYDKLNKEFRGSIVKLDENTDYQIKGVLTTGETNLAEYTNSFKTWLSEPAYTTMNISAFYNKYSNCYDINGIVGTEDNWIKIVGNQTVNVPNTVKEYAISITNSKYLILEGITSIGGGKNGIYIPKGSSQIRIVNCDISKWGIASQNQRIDGVYLDIRGNEINYNAGVYIEEGKDVVVERCYIHDSNVKTNPWAGIVEDGQYKGTLFNNSHPQGSTGIFVSNAIDGIVIRYNDIIGNQIHRFNDVIESYNNSLVNGGFNQNADIYGNMMAFSQDDAIELDGGQCNVRLFNNRFEQSYTGISLAPNMKGPSYIFNNVLWNLGCSTGVESVSVKNGGGTTYSIGRQFLFNNTFVVTKSGMSGIGFGNDQNRTAFYATTRNNIFVSEETPKSPYDGLSIRDVAQSSWNDFDYDVIGNTTVNDGAGMILAKAGSESNGIYTMPQFDDLESGVFTLKSTDKGIDKGLIIPNFSDGYKNSAPDMGALELSSSSLIPVRPIDITSDKYSIKMTCGVDSKLTLNVGVMNQPTKFTICKSDDMSWLTVVANTDIISSNSTIQLTLKAVPVDYKQIGMIIIRLENGFSVPISVSADTSNQTPQIKELDLQIYPNPVFDVLTIKGKSENEKVIIRDYLGRKSLESFDDVLNVSSLSSGVYLLKIQDVTRKFIKK